MASLGVAAIVASPLCAQMQSHSSHELFHTKHSHPCGGCLFRGMLSDMLQRGICKVLNTAFLCSLFNAAFVIWFSKMLTVKRVDSLCNHLITRALMHSGTQIIEQMRVNLISGVHASSGGIRHLSHFPIHGCGCWKSFCCDLKWGSSKLAASALADCRTEIASPLTFSAPLWGLESMLETGLFLISMCLSLLHTHSQSVYRACGRGSKRECSVWECWGDVSFTVWVKTDGRGVREILSYTHNKTCIM